MPAKNLVGQKFGRLTALERVSDKYYGEYAKVVWKCICDCGSVKEVLADCLLSGNTKSCGCLANEIKHRTDNKYKKHGLHNTRLHKIWDGMKMRCYNPNHEAYFRYGGRGIFICDEWLNDDNGFQNFYNWAMLNDYSNTLTLDRINNNKGYSPDNCKWSTNSEQQHNRNDNVIITNGNKTQYIDEWMKETGLSRGAIKWRLKHWGNTEKLFIPAIKRKSPKQSGVKGVIWNDQVKQWFIYSTKNGKKHCYIGERKKLEDAIKFQKDYESNLEIK